MKWLIIKRLHNLALLSNATQEHIHLKFNWMKCGSILDVEKHEMLRNIRCRSILGEEKSCIWDFFFFNLHNLLQIRFVAIYAVLCETCPIYAPFTWTKTWAQDFVRGERMTNIMCMIHCHSNMECGLWQMCIGHMIKWWEEKNHNLRTCNNLLLSSTLMKACDISYVVYIRNSIIHKTMLWLLFVSLNLWGKN